MTRGQPRPLEKRADGSGALAADFEAVTEGGVSPTRSAYLFSACQFEQRPHLPQCGTLTNVPNCGCVLGAPETMLAS